MATAVKKRAAAERVYSPEEQRVRAAVERYMPSVRDVVRSYDVDFREDHAGEPAVYVTLRIPKPDDAEPKRIKRILKFWNKVSLEILEQDWTHFPYVKLAGVTKR